MNKETEDAVKNAIKRTIWLVTSESDIDAWAEAIFVNWKKVYVTEKDNEAK
jgi:hypothetical protein